MAFKLVKTDEFQQRDYFAMNKIKKCRNYDLCCGEIWLTQNPGFNYPGLCDKCSFISKKRDPSIKRTNRLVCNICGKKGYCYKRYDCHHVLCKICVQLCDYGIPDITDFPPFPYPEIEDQVFTQTDLLWKSKYPLIQVWEDQCALIDEKIMARRKIKSNSKTCPLCKK